MSILKHTIIENNVIKPEYKSQFGEIHSPFSLIDSMFSAFPQSIFEDPNHVWMDIGAGRGNFSIVLFYKLDQSLKKTFPTSKIRREHILRKMIYMVEINPENIRTLKIIFGENANIIYDDYMSHLFQIQPSIIIGNPPFNINGGFKVPTNSLSCKKQDGKNAWIPFIKKSLQLLPENGFMNIIIPSIWMKPDKANVYNTLLEYDITHLKCYSASETNKIFSGEAQTPTCSFLLTKTFNTRKKIEIYDSFLNKYIDFSLSYNIPIPLQYGSITEKIIKISKKYPALPIQKSNMPSRKTILVDEKTETFPYENISTYIQKNPFLIKKYSNLPCAFYGESKIILAHKMYGFPFLDKEGKYGICNRDNYIISNSNLNELEIILHYLQHPIVYFLYETTRYRMRYLEKYAFEYLFDFSYVFQNKNTCLYDFFNLSKEERIFIDKFKK